MFDKKYFDKASLKEEIFGFWFFIRYSMSDVRFFISYLSTYYTFALFCNPLIILEFRIQASKLTVPMISIGYNPFSGLKSKKCKSIALIKLFYF